MTYIKTAVGAILAITTIGGAALYFPETFATNDRVDEVEQNTLKTFESFRRQMLKDDLERLELKAQFGRADEFDRAEMERLKRELEVPTQ